MKKITALLAAACLCLNLAACQSGSEEKLPESQVYTTADGLYSVTLPKGMTQNDLQIQVNSTMTSYDSPAGGLNISAISLGSGKDLAPSAESGSVTDLESYADTIVSMFMPSGTDGDPIQWSDAEPVPMDGMETCLAREGAINVSGVNGTVFMECMESEEAYYAVVLFGTETDVKETKDILEVKELRSLSEGTGSAKNFLYGMTAVLDEMNGGNMLDIVSAMDSAGMDKSQVQESTQLTLEGYWEVTDANSLDAMFSWLLSEGHNDDMLSLLAEYEVTEETTREDMERRIEEDGIEGSGRVFLLTAYDAWSRFGDSAIRAWDLSRAVSVMEMGYAAGYCTYDEAVENALKAARAAQEEFSSWEDFNDSYLYGFSYWSGEALDQEGTGAAERAEIVSRLEGLSGGLFSTDWNTDLTEEQ